MSSSARKAVVTRATSPAGAFPVTQSTTYSASQNYLTDVGAFTNNESAYGTFDQSGNVVIEWNDLDGSAGSSRGQRGGYWNGLAFLLSSSTRYGDAPVGEYDIIGFRLASPLSGPSGVPEIDPAGMRLAAALLAGVLALLERRRYGR
ncbi:MAG: hypothetical protein EBR86_15705 [Planctomycetia bacterium]|nr:hypothetical protein [Planctomycetia bacterium]